MQPRPGSAAKRKNQWTAENPSILDWPTLMPLICSSIAMGNSLRTTLKAEGMPNKQTVMERLARSAEFREMYQMARTFQADGFFDEIIDISDDGTNDWMARETRHGTVLVGNHEHVHRSRLRVDSRKWVLSKMNPKKYGALAETPAAPLEHAKALTELRELLLKAAPDVDPPADS